jgi:hypothetical protein
VQGGRESVAAWAFVRITSSTADSDDRTKRELVKPETSPLVVWVPAKPTCPIVPTRRSLNSNAASQVCGSAIPALWDESRSAAKAPGQLLYAKPAKNARRPFSSRGGSPEYPPPGRARGPCGSGLLCMYLYVHSQLFSATARTAIVHMRTPVHNG